MKILLINDHYSFGGAENYVRALQKQLEEEHEVAVLTLDGSDESDYSVDESGNPLFKLRNRYFSNRKIKRKVSNVIEDLDPDAVHLNKNVVAPIPVLKALRDENVVRTVHDFGFVCLQDKYAYEMHPAERKVRKILDRGTQKYLDKLREEVIDQYVAPSKALKKELENNNYKPVQQLYNFVEDREPSFGGKHFLFVGRLESGKAPDLIIEAYSDHENLGDLPPLEIAGKGKMKKQLEEKVKENALGEKITVNGYVSEERLEELYQNSKAVIVPSKWRENNPLVALEAKAYGKPLIVSDRGGLPELVEERETGFVFESENTGELMQKISEKTDWMELGKKSREDYKRNFTPEAHTEKLLELYREVEEKQE